MGSETIQTYCHCGQTVNERHMIPLKWCHIGTMASSITTQLFVQEFTQTTDKENIKAFHPIVNIIHQLPVSPKKGQWCGKRFYVITFPLHSTDSLSNIYINIQCPSHSIYIQCFTYQQSLTEPVINSHYNDVTMGAMASQITSLTIVYSTVYSGADQRKHQSSASLAFVWGIHRWPVNSPHKGPITRKMFSSDDVNMRLHAVMIYCIMGQVKHKGERFQIQCPQVTAS